MNTYMKIGSDWVIASSAPREVGTVVTMSLKSGASKQETVGESRGSYRGQYVYSIAPKAKAAAQQIGDLNGLLALFDRAKAHLKFPAIVLHDGGAGIRISVAGQRARVPGSLSVTAFDKPDYEEKRAWYGRVLRSGSYEAAAAAPAHVADKLRELAADPAKVASEHGRLTGRCCFCNLALSDERSTAVGYGKICADHYGLPWGAKPAEFAASAA